MQSPRQLSFRLSATFMTFCFFVAFSGAAQAQLVAFGASNVAGKGVFSSQAWPAVLENLLKAKGYNVQVKNAGISGDTTAHMLKRVDSSIPVGTKIVLLDMGGGFFNNSKADIPHAQGEADMKAIAARLRARGITIIPITSSTMPTSLRQADRVHLTAEGHRAFAQQLLPKVIGALGAPHSS